MAAVEPESRLLDLQAVARIAFLRRIGWMCFSKSTLPVAGRETLVCAAAKVTKAKRRVIRIESLLGCRGPELYEDDIHVSRANTNLQENSLRFEPPKIV